MKQDIGDKLPRGVAISWGLVKEPQRGPKRELSVKRIADAAVAIADKEGLGAVSMSRVAESLGFTTMSLYRYIPSKDDLLLLMQEAVSDVPIPPARDGEDWRDVIREYFQATIKLFRDHPWFGDIPIQGAPITPNSLRFADWSLRAFRGLPLNAFEQMSIVLLLASYARACGLLGRDLDRAMRAGASPESISGSTYGDALKQLVTPEQYPDLYPLVASGAYAGENGEAAPVEADFEFGLERILDGIEHYLKTKKAMENNGG